MSCRLRGLWGVVLVGVLGVVSVVAAPPVVVGSASRALVDFSLDLVPGAESTLVVRPAEEPYAFTEARISGRVDSVTGAISQGSFSTPPVTFDMEALGFPLRITATFSEVAPGTGRGVVTSDGDVRFQTSVQVALHLLVGFPNPFLDTTCVAGPISLSLASTSPYDVGAGRVVVVDNGFVIPPVVSQGGCSDVVIGPINDAIAGGGHGLSMAFGGVLPLPPPPLDPSVTTLAVEPAAGARFGEAVTLTATVAPGVGSSVSEVPTGFVEFRSGTRVLSSQELDEAGKATFTTDTGQNALAAADHDLRAVYLGSGVYASSSDAQDYRVASDPLITWNLPSTIRIDQGAASFDLTVINTGLGLPVENARVDLTFRRLTADGDRLDQNRLLLERKVGDDWQSVTLTQGGNSRTVVGSLGDPMGFVLGVGQSVTEGLRLDGSPPGGAVVEPGPVTVTVELVQVNPETGAKVATIATAEGRTTLIEANRAPSRFVDVGGRGTPPFRPHTVRQGYQVRLGNVNIDSFSGGPSMAPRGAMEILIGGRKVGLRLTTTPFDEGFVSPWNLSKGDSGLQFMVPVDLPTGEQTVTLRYLGDAVFEPSEWEGTIHVLPARGVPYDCQVRALSEYRFSANVTAQVNLPAVAVGGPVALNQLDVRAFTDRGPTTIDRVRSSGGSLANGSGVNVVGENGLREVSVVVSPSESPVLGTGIEAGNLVVMADATRPVDPDPDGRLRWLGLDGAAVLSGEPGDVVPVTLDSVGFDSRNNIVDVVSCVPVDGPVVLGEVMLAGTRLVVDPSGPVRAGDEVRLSARVAPVDGGVVVFEAAGVTLGVAPVDGDGNAVISTRAIPAGAGQVTARFVGSLSLPSTSDTVDIEVLAALVCPQSAVEGSPALVRAAYLDVLGRCPSAGEVDYWAGRLDAGLAAGSFGRQIASSREALGLLVDEAFAIWLERPADPDSREYWVAVLASNPRYDRLVAQIAGSGEFRTRFAPSNTVFVNELYARLLGRSPGEGERSWWVGQLNGGSPRWSVARAMANTSEALGRVVDAAYDGLLDRPPTGDERTTAIARLRATGSRPGLSAALIGTGDYAQRADTFPHTVP